MSRVSVGAQNEKLQAKVIHLHEDSAELNTKLALKETEKVDERKPRKASLLRVLEKYQMPLPGWKKSTDFSDEARQKDGSINSPAFF